MALLELFAITDDTHLSVLRLVTIENLKGVVYLNVLCQ